MHRLILIVVILIGVLAACNRAETPKQTQQPQEKAANNMAFSMKSAAFEYGVEIPKKYTCQGVDLSPPLAWSEPPKGTKSYALICDDPDAPSGTFVHWVAWGISADSLSLPEGVAKSQSTSVAKQGLNSVSQTGYMGPCPPPGKPHRYFFKLFALDAELNLPSSTNKASLEKAMQGHILGEAQIMCTYKR